MAASCRTCGRGTAKPPEPPDACRECVRRAALAALLAFTRDHPHTSPARCKAVYQQAADVERRRQADELRAYAERAK